MREPDLFFVPYDDFLADVQALAAALEGDRRRPDYIVGIGRGGLVPATYLSHRTGIRLLTLDYSAGLPDLVAATIARLASFAQDGRSILLVDDINDSGVTIKALRALLRSHGTPADAVRVAVLLDNVRSSERVEYRARVIDRDRDKRWFVFPWEAMAERRTLVEEAEAVPDRLG